MNSMNFETKKFNGYKAKENGDKRIMRGKGCGFKSSYWWKLSIFGEWTFYANTCFGRNIKCILYVKNLRKMSLKRSFFSIHRKPQFAKKKQSERSSYGTQKQTSLFRSSIQEYAFFIYFCRNSILFVKGLRQAYYI